MTAAGKRIGRPIKPAVPGERQPLGLRVSAATKALVEALARGAGRTQSQEVEFLIERCLQYDRMLVALGVTERELAAAQARRDAQPRRARRRRRLSDRRQRSARALASGLMSEIDDLVAASIGWHRADDDEWSVREWRERHDEYFRAMAALQRRERRERVARALAVVKQARKVGLPVKRAIIDGVDLELGEPAPASPVTELDQWIAKHHARSA
jgi:hypothetical protein